MILTTFNKRTFDVCLAYTREEVAERHLAKLPNSVKNIHENVTAKAIETCLEADIR